MASRIIAAIGGGGGGGGGGNGGGAVDAAPHDHSFSETVTVGPYTNVQTWDRGSALVDGRMYRTGVQPDTTKEFMHIGLLIEGSVPKTLAYKRIRTAEWLTLELVILASDDTQFNEDVVGSGLLGYPTNDRYNIISLHLRRYQDADGNNLLACGIQVNQSGDQPSGNVHGLLYFYEDKSLEVEVAGDTSEEGAGGGAAGGSGLVPKTFADATEPTAENVGLIENLEGVLYEHYRSHHVGHGKTIGGTASPGTWITLSHDDFLGFYTHSHPPPDNEFTHGKFYYGRDYGSFLIHRVHGEGGFTGVTGNFTYDPFDEGEPWHEVTIAGAEVDLNFRGGVDHLSIAFAAANGIGEAFANRGAHEIVYVSEFMAQSAGYDEFFRRIYVSPNAKNPIVEFWGQGQAAADPVNPVDRAITGGGVYYRYEWAQEKPNLIIGSDFGVRAVDAADVTGADLIPVGDPALTRPAEAALGNQRVLKFPAGQYRIYFNASHRVDQNSVFGAWVFCIDPSTDVVKRYSASGRADDQTRTPFGPLVEANQIGQKVDFVKVLDLASETFITIISGVFDDIEAEKVDGFHSIGIEKLS